MYYVVSYLVNLLNYVPDIIVLREKLVVISYVVVISIILRSGPGTGAKFVTITVTFFFFPFVLRNRHQSSLCILILIFLLFYLFISLLYIYNSLGILFGLYYYKLHYDDYYSLLLSRTRKRGAVGGARSQHCAKRTRTCPIYSSTTELW